MNIGSSSLHLSVNGLAPPWFFASLFVRHFLGLRVFFGAPLRSSPSSVGVVRAGCPSYGAGAAILLNCRRRVRSLQHKDANGGSTPMRRNGDTREQLGRFTRGTGRQAARGATFGDPLSTSGALRTTCSSPGPDSVTNCGQRIARPVFGTWHGDAHRGSQTPLPRSPTAILLRDPAHGDAADWRLPSLAGNNHTNSCFLHLLAMRCGVPGERQASPTMKSQAKARYRAASAMPCGHPSDLGRAARLRNACPRRIRESSSRGGGGSGWERDSTVGRATTTRSERTRQ